MRRFCAFLLAATMVLTASAAPHGAMVFAAASLTDCLTKIGAEYARQTGQRPDFNFAASSFLARQIEEGAPADIFFSADEAKMDALESKGLLAAGTRKSRLSNTLVIIVPADSQLKLQSAKNLAEPAIRRIALADPRAVPAGVYAKEYFEKEGLWPRLEPKVVPCENVRAALAAVESGNAEAGVVYKTDAAISRRAKVACVIPVGDGPRISYPVAIIKDCQHPEAAAKFLKFLESAPASKVFEECGFVVQ